MMAVIENGDGDQTRKLSVTSFSSSFLLSDQKTVIDYLVAEQ